MTPRSLPDRGEMTGYGLAAAIAVPATVALGAFGGLLAWALIRWRENRG